jgi:hypothetical protein
MRVIAEPEAGTVRKDEPRHGMMRDPESIHEFREGVIQSLFATGASF